MSQDDSSGSTPKPAATTTTTQPVVPQVFVPRLPNALTFSPHDPVPELFMKLTKYTCPHLNMGKSRTFAEDALYGRQLEDLGAKRDSFGNYYLWRGVPDTCTTVFACHLDTADQGYPGRVRHYRDDYIIATDGTSILGADNKAGMVVLLKLISQSVPGLYCFFVGEEVGLHGSRFASRSGNVWSQFRRFVMFDREGEHEIITHMNNGRCCSDRFAADLGDKFREQWEDFELRPSPHGFSTDAANFKERIPECVNIGSGCWHTHKMREYQDIRYLQRLADAAVRIRWNQLPTWRVLP